MLLFDEPTGENGYLSQHYPANFAFGKRMYETVAAYLEEKKNAEAGQLPYLLYEANKAKFLQNGELLEKLLATGESFLAACLPGDAVLGTGLKKEETCCTDFPGQNLLGFALMAVRSYARDLQKQNECRVYFKITGNFVPEEISALLGVAPGRAWKCGDLRRDGKKYAFSLWQAPPVTEYTPFTEEQMKAAIAPFVGKEAILRDIRCRFDAEFTLAVVPHLITRETTPSLAPSEEIMTFCQETGTRLDIDLYLSE